MAKVKRTEVARWLEKNGYATIEPMEFYRWMFPQGELVEYSDDPRDDESNREWKYNAVLQENTHVMKTVKKIDPKDKKNPNIPREEKRIIYTEKEIWNNFIILDDLERIKDAVDKFGKTESEYFIAPNSYIGRFRSKKTERYTYAAVFDIDHPKTQIIDGHREQVGVRELIHMWTNSSYPILPPSAVVCSGSGLHLVYFLDRPYQLIDEYQKEQWDNFRFRFTKRVWNKYVTKEHMQYQNHCQIFRVVGTRSKKNHLVEAFWVSKQRYTIDELFGQFKYDEYPKWDTWEEFNKILEKVGGIEGLSRGLYKPDELMKQEKGYMPKGKKNNMSPKMAAAKAQWPEWYEDIIVKGNPRKKPGQWSCPRGLYDWFLREAKEDAYVGSRFNRVRALAQYAIKCRVSFDEFAEDAKELYEIFKLVSEKEPFYWIEFKKARDEYFAKIPYKSTRDWIEEKTGVHMKPPAKRNGRKQKEHLDRVNQIRKFRRDVLEEDEYINNGRPVGSGTKQEIVQRWREEHPDGRKVDCIRETGLSKPTVLKWWDA